MQHDLTGHKSEPVRSFVYADVLTQKAKSQAPSVVLACHGAVASPRVLFYHIDVFLSIISGDFTVCLFGCGDEGCLLYAAFSAGSTLGLKCGSRTAAAPDCAKETSLPGLSSCDSRPMYALRGRRPILLYRRLAKLQFMVWQVVWCPAAASGSRTAATRVDGRPGRLRQCGGRTAAGRAGRAVYRCYLHALSET